MWHEGLKRFFYVYDVLTVPSENLSRMGLLERCRYIDYVGRFTANGKSRKYNAKEKRPERLGGGHYLNALHGRFWRGFQIKIRLPSKLKFKPLINCYKG